MNEDQRPGWTAKQRSQYLSAAQLRQRLLGTAVSEIRKTGLTVSLEHLQMERLIRLAEVPRSSFFKEWGTKENFYVDLMVELVRPGGSTGFSFDAGTLEVIQGVLSENDHRLSDMHGRREVKREIIRLAAQRNFHALASSGFWQTYTALSVSISSLPDETARQRVLAALSEAEAQVIQSAAGVYAKILPLLGLRMKTGFTTSHLASAGAAVIDGLVLRRHDTPHINSPLLLPGLDGETVEWHLAGVSILGIVDTMTEEVPIRESTE